MRPLRLEMTGFAAFREHTVVDFEGYDLLAFTGPTGAGKSSIIDGIAFALFGSVARYGNEKLIAPIINTVSAEARVRLDFGIGPNRYSAVRVVRRTATGASTKEARLEKLSVGISDEGDTLAGTAAEVTSAVEELLGLTFAQFTKTIVLPQGDFARFLTETAGDRQTLLRRLLGLDVYSSMGTHARRRSKDAEIEAEATRQALGTVEIVTDAAMTRLTKAADKIDAATTAAGETHDELLDALQAQAKTVDDLERIDEAVTQLQLLAIPDDAKDYESDVAAADDVAAKAQEARDAACEKRQIVSDQLGALTPAEEVAEALALHDRSDDLTRSCADLDAAATAEKDALAATEAEAAETAAKLSTARDELERTRVAAGAAGIAATLSIGDDCPVCARVIDELPETHDHDVDRLADLVSDAEAAAKRARDSVGAASTRATTAEVSAANERALLDTVTGELASRPDRKELKATATKVEAAMAALDEATSAEATAEAALTQAVAERTTVGSRASELARDFVAARDAVGSLDPPVPSSNDVVENWSELIDWSATKTTELEKERGSLSKRAEADAKAVAALEKRLRSKAKPFEVDPALPADQIHQTLLKLRGEAAAIRDDAAFRQKRDAENTQRIIELDEEVVVSRELGRLLNAKGFEQWLMSDVMIDLADRATERLAILSSGAYSLTTDGTDFSVIDHRNADEIRSARTLSGGETFLASLSLALALADSITDMASTTVPPTESVFLDEGFGTLDPETLDLVANAIEELGAEGRLVCIVTHISELADRLPHHVRVTKSPTGSTVSQDVPA